MQLLSEWWVCAGHLAQWVMALSTPQASSPSLRDTLLSLHLTLSPSPTGYSSILICETIEFYSRCDNVEYDSLSVCLVLLCQHRSAIDIECISMPQTLAQFIKSLMWATCESFSHLDSVQWQDLSLSLSSEHHQVLPTNNESGQL